MQVKVTNRGTIDAPYGKYNTNVPSVFAAGIIVEVKALSYGRFMKGEKRLVSATVT